MIKMIWEDDCTEWNSQVNKAATHVGKYFKSLGRPDYEVKEIIGRFMDFVTEEENRS